MTRRLLAAVGATAVALTLVTAAPASAASPEAPEEDPVRAAEYWIDD